MTFQGDTPKATALHAARLELAFSAAGMGTWMWDVKANTVDWDAPMEAVFGLAPGTFPGTYEAYQSMLHPEDRAAAGDAVAEAVRTKGEHHIEHRILRADGEIRWMTGSGRVILDDDGEIIAMVGVGIDITDRKQAEARVDFLARAGELLGSSLHLPTTLEQVARLAIEELADWCSVDLLDGDEVTLVAVAHSDPAKVEYARALRERLPVDLYAQNGLGYVLATGRPEIRPDIDEVFIRGELAKYPHLLPEDVEQFVDLGLRAAMTLPLVTNNGKILGALTLVSAESLRRYNDADLELAMELARRAAVAVDNASLYRAAAHASATLQRSLLPPSLPSLPFADVAAYYAPAGNHDLIGGDFYDLFRLPNERWGFIVGDVAGKGVEAAALTAASRWTLRAALSWDDSPAAALSELNRALLEESADRFVTAAVGVIYEQDGVVQLTYASGGHPSPILRQANGTCAPLEAQGRIVGVIPGPVTTDRTITLAPGEVLAIFSDGFTEARQGSTFFGEEGMCHQLAQWEGTSAKDAIAFICDAVAAYGPQRDDMALMVVAINPAE